MKRALLRPGFPAAAPAALAVAALLAAAGCAPARAELPRDALATEASAGVLEAYATDDAGPGAAETATTGPTPPPRSRPPVELPGRPETPWLGSPRTLPFPAEPPGEPGPEPAPVIGGAPAAPAGSGLRPGDLLNVTVARHREFGGEWRVSATGQLAIPRRGAFGVGEFTGEAFARAVGPVSGLTAGEAADRIAERLKTFCRRRPRVSVEVLGRAEVRP